MSCVWRLKHTERKKNQVQAVSSKGEVAPIYYVVSSMWALHNTIASLGAAKCSSGTEQIESVWAPKS